jgi:DNA adenine methylase
MISRPALRYFGGKWLLADWIIAHLPPHRCYVEPFCGAASVLLRKEPSQIEVMNDVSGRVVNFFRVLRERPDELIQLLELTPMALDEYRECRTQEGGAVERARRFFVESWQAYSGASGSERCQGWRRTCERDVARQFAASTKNLHHVAARLRQVAIDNLDWREVLKRYDRAETLFYVDPPYMLGTRGRTWPSAGYGKNDFTDKDHEELLGVLLRLKGAVVLSGYPTDLYDTTLRGWSRDMCRVTKKLKPTKDGAVEVLWCNRPWGGKQISLEGLGL